MQPIAPGAVQETSSPPLTSTRQLSEQSSRIYDMVQSNHRTALLNEPNRVARELKRDLDKKGIATLTDFFTPEAMEMMRERAMEHYEVCLGGEKRKALIAEDLQGTIFYELAKSDLVRDLCNPVLRPFGYQINNEDSYPVLNLLQGPKARDGVHSYHFDATLLTLAVPIIMPDPNSPNPGSFRIWPNVRSFSTSNLKERIFWKVMHKPRLRDLFSNFSVDFRPGNLYLFYGYRSWHGTGELDETKLRANCLINVSGPRFYLNKNKPLLPKNERTQP